MKKIIDRVKDNYRNNKLLFYIMFFLWVMICFFSCSMYGNTLGKESFGNDFYDSVIQVDENVIIKQELLLDKEVSDVCIRFATYARPTNNGNVTVKIVSKQELIKEEVIDVKNIQDNAYYVIGLDDVIKEKTPISVSITSNCKSNECVGVYYTIEDNVVDSLMFVNGELKTGDLSIRFLKSNNELSKFSNTIIICAITAFSILVLILLLVNPKYEIMFPMIILVFGLIFMIIIVPLSPPDEQYHYESAFQLSNILLGSKEHLEINKTYLYYGHLYGHYNISGGYVRFIEDFSIPLKLSSKTIKQSSDVLDVYNICFIPQAIGITIARLFKVNMLKTFYSARLFNLLFYILSVYISLKKTASHKMMLGMICCMPMFIQTAASCSYDCFIISLCVVMISYFLRWMFVDEKIKLIDYVIVLLCSIGIAPIKFVYGFIPLIYVFIPSSRFINKIYKFVFVSILILPGLGTLLPLILERVIKYADNLFDSIIKNKEIIDETNDVLKISGNDVVSFTTEEAENKTFESIYSMKFIFEHPVETIGIFARTIRYSIKNWFYGSLGNTLSGSTLVLPLSLTHLISIVFIVSAFRKENFTLNSASKITLICICIGIGLLMMVGMFVTWTDQSQTVIQDFGGIMVQGIQGRYFSPLLPYFAVALNNKKIYISEKIDKFLIFAYIAIMLNVVLYIMSYTFIN